MMENGAKPLVRHLPRCVIAGVCVSTLTMMAALAAAPVAYDDLITAKSDTQSTLDYLVLNDKDADGNTLSITAVTSPAHGTLTALGGNSYLYTPTSGYAGRDSFTYTVADGTGGTDTALVSISVNAAYDVTAARNTILAGVTQLADVTGNRVAYAWGATAASISNYRGQDESNSMIAAATMGVGRVVVMADSSWQNMNTLGGQFNTSTCYQNSISWVTNTTSKTIPILAMTSEVSAWLTAQGYTNVTTTTAAGLAAALPGKAVLIPGRFDPALSGSNITAVKNFIQGGGGLFCFEGTYTTNATATILREAGISFDPGSEADFEPPFTINRADSLTTTDLINVILKNPAGYATADKVAAARVAQHVIRKLSADDIERVRLLDSMENSFAAITPTPQAPVTDEFQRMMLTMECAQINALPVAQMTAHRAALPVSAAAPRVSNMAFGLVAPLASHETKTIYTPFYAAPGELVTITFPAALTTLNLDVRTSHLRSAPGDTTSYPVMPVQMIDRDVTSTSVQVANPHGGLIQIIVPSNVTWTGTQNITVSGAVQAPYFKLGETTDAQWAAGIRDRGTPFGVLDSNEATLVVDADKWLRTLVDPEAVITEWNYFCGKVREFYAYNPGRQLPVHHDYYPVGGFSSYPQSYGLTSEITHSLNLKASAYSLTLHEYGHICDSGNIQFDEFSETSPNMGGKWLQETERKYSWKQELIVGRINNYLSSQSDDLWNNAPHHVVDWKGTPFDVLAAEFGPEMIQDSVAAMTAMPAISTSQGKIDEWARQLSNRSGFNMCAFLASWQIDASAAVQTELSSKPNWMPVERAPESLTVVQGTPVVFADPSTNDFSYDGGLTLTNVSQPGSGSIVNNGNGTYTYTPVAGFAGSTSFTYTVTNATGNTFTTTVPVKVVTAANEPKLAAFDGVAKGGAWTTITLPKSYSSMVVVAQPIVGAGAPPMVARIRNASGASFEVRLDRLDGSATPVALTGVRFLVVEEGVYNVATHGIKMEAVKFTSSTTDRKDAFTGTTRDFAYTGYDHYFIPAVFGQVMTTNDDRWSAFWYDSGVNNVQLGKHVGEDTVTTRANETIGYIVMESGSYQFGNDQIQVGVTNVDAYAGFNLVNESTSSHDFARFPALHSAQVSASMEKPWGESDLGKDGFVTMQKVAGGNGLSAYLVEDSIGDAETATGKKGGGYLLAHRTDGAPFAKSDQVMALAGSSTLIKVLDNDEIVGAPIIQVTQPANGTVVVLSDGSLVYTPNAGFVGNDSFSYSLTTAQGSSTSFVSIQVSPVNAANAGVTADRFDGITGGTIASLTGNANYPANPSTRTVWTSLNSGQNVGDNLGHHIYGLVVPPTTGDYTFWIASDDQSQLFLSSDASPANAVMIASVSGYTTYQNWTQTASQQSAVIPLVAGRAYYLKVLHKEGTGGDHVSVAWQGPGFARKLLANPDMFTAVDSPPLLVAAPANVTMNEGAAPTVIDVSGVFSSTDPGDPLTIAVHGNTRPDIVSATLVGNTLSVAQSGSATGTATITLRATDRTNTLVTTSFTVTIVKVNDAPVFTSNPITGSGGTEDVAYSGSIASYASDADAGDSLSFIKVSGPAWLGVSQAGALSGTPGNSDVGANSFVVRVTDTAGASATATLNIAVTGINQNGVWGNPAGGSWLAGGNWSGGMLANGVGKTADFSTLNLTSNTTVTLDGARTVGGLIFGDTTPSHNWALNTGSGGPLTLSVSSGSPVISVANQTTTIGTALAGSQGMTKSGAGTLALTGVNTYTGATGVSAGTLQLGDGIIQPTINSAYDIASGATLRIQYNSTGSAAQTWSKYTGAGTLALKTGKNFDYGWGTTGLGSGFTGTLRIESGRANTSTAAGGGLGGTTNIVVKTGGQLGMWNGGTSNQNFTIEGTGYGEGSGYDAALRFANAGLTTTLNGGIALTDSATIGARGTGIGMLNGVISGATPATLTFGTSTLNGKVVLTGNNTYSGNTTIAAGTLEIGGSGKLGNGSYAGNIANAGTFRHASSSAQTLSGVISGTGFLTKAGTATLTLTGANTYTGTTAVNGGSLQVNGSLANSATTVAAAGTLGGSGTIAGAVTNNGSLAPGSAGVGNLTVNNTLTLGGDSNIDWEVSDWSGTAGTGWDKLTASSLNLAATSDNPVTIRLGETALANFTEISQTFTLVQTTGGISGFSADQFVIDASALTTPQGSWAVQQSGNNLVLAYTRHNTAPAFASDPILAADATISTAYTGQTLAGKATDADAGDTVTYSKVSGPAWLVVAQNGSLTGTPPAGSAGLNTFVVRVTDTSSATDDAELRINVGSLPLPWISGGIGTGMLAGSASYSSGTFTLAGSGAIGGTTDKLQFAYQTLTGDGEIIARISSLQNTGTSSRVGVMIRDTLATNSRGVFFGLSDTGSYRWERRFNTGGNNISYSSGSGTVPNTWVRLKRVGATITAYKGSDGVNWTSVTSGTVNMAANCYIGLAVSSGSNTTLNTSQISNVSVTP